MPSARAMRFVPAPSAATSRSLHMAANSGLVRDSSSTSAAARSVVPMRAVSARNNATMTRA